MTKERRKFIRAFIYAPAIFSTRNKQGKAGIIDLSSVGLRMTTVKKLTPGEKITLNFHLPNRLPIQINGKIKHHTGIFYGISFHPTDIKIVPEQMELEKYILTLRAQQDSWLLHRFGKISKK